jgi:hypothetical protein
MTHREEQSMRRRIKSTHIADSVRDDDHLCVACGRVQIIQFGVSRLPVILPVTVRTHPDRSRL